MALTDLARPRPAPNDPVPAQPAPTDNDGAAPRLIPVGTKVEVRRKFDANWASGFEVAETGDDGYVLRRLSDNELIPVPFALEDVRKERKRNNWWY